MLKRTAYTLILTLLISNVPLGRARVLPGGSPGSKRQSSRRKVARQKASSCSVCSVAQPDAFSSFVGSYAKTGGHPDNYAFQPVSRSIFEGVPVNLVNTATGSLVFRVRDLELHSSPAPIEFVRVYDSDRKEDYGLGTGWSFLFDDRITIDHERAVMITGVGSAITFRRDGQSTRFIVEMPQPGPHQSFEVTDSGEILEQADGLSRTYGKIGPAYRLTRIDDPNGYQTTLIYDKHGSLKSIASASGKMAVEWSSGKRPKIRSVTDSTGRRVRFGQSDHFLTSVTDPAGARWTYEYDGSGRLSLAADPVGRTLLRARYNSSGAVLEAGDAVGAHHYEYTPWSEGARISRRTVVTNSLGAVTAFEHNANGAIVATIDDEGNAASVEYNSANRFGRVSDTAGNEAGFTYDSQNRLVKVLSNTGVDKSFTFDERGYLSSVTAGDSRTTYRSDDRGNVVAANTGNPESSHTAVLNQRGQPVSITSGTGQQVSLEYDAAGNRTSYSYADIGRFAEERDGAGRVTTRRLPSGVTNRYEYDSRGNLVKKSDSLGKWKAVKRDASGLITRVVNQDDRWIQASRDEMGRIVALTNWKAEVSHYNYDSRGALTEVTNAEGERYQFVYDRRGRLISGDEDVWVYCDVEFSCCCSDGDPECSFCNGDGGGGGGGGGGPDSEQCAQCVANQVQICDSQWQACADRVAAAYVGAVLACFLLVNPVAIAACEVLVLGAAIYSRGACDSERNACYFGARSRCPVCT